eukprot:4421962-Amphidinium_carterae.1
MSLAVLLTLVTVSEVNRSAQFCKAKIFCQQQAVGRPGEASSGSDSVDMCQGAVFVTSCLRRAAATVQSSQPDFFDPNEPSKIWFVCVGLLCNTA